MSRANRYHEDTIILEPRIAFDLGIIGYNEEEGRLIYSIAKLITALMNHYELSHMDAVEWLEYNTLGVGGIKKYPIFIMEEEENE